MNIFLGFLPDFMQSPAQLTAAACLSCGTYVRYTPAWY